MMRLVHLSDFHLDGSAELGDALDAMIDAALDLRPDVVVVTGDLTARGSPAEFDAVLAALDRFGSIPRVVIPGNRDVEPSVGAPGDAKALPVDSDLDYFLTLQPALTLGLPDADAGPAPRDAWLSRFPTTMATYSDERVHIVGVDSTPRLRSEALELAAAQLRAAPTSALRVFALHHGLLPVPGGKLRDGDLTSRSGDVLALLCDLEVDLALHGHIHRAHCWEIGVGTHRLVIASAGALVNDGRRDASFLEVLADDGRLEVWRRSVATGRPTILHDGPRSMRVQEE